MRVLLLIRPPRRSARLGKPFLNIVHTFSLSEPCHSCSPSHICYTTTTWLLSFNHNAVLHPRKPSKSPNNVLFIYFLSNQYDRPHNNTRKCTTQTPHYRRFKMSGHLLRSHEQCETFSTTDRGAKNQGETPRVGRPARYVPC